MTNRDWLRARAKEMRVEMTPHEKAVWRLLRTGELAALNWRRQNVFGGFILDFVSHPARLVVEVDGPQHGMTPNAAHDEGRSRFLASEGYRVLRFKNGDIAKHGGDIWREIHVEALKTPAAARLLRARLEQTSSVLQHNARLASSSMEEAPRSGGGGAPSVFKLEALRASPPQSALRADSSPIEGER